jgi:REP element-mobilizing transposase RayT
MREFNVIEPIGSLYRNAQNQNRSGRTATIHAGEQEKIVNLLAYCINPNHFHLILEQLVEGGVSEFMKRLCGGYAWYFNHKHKRSGTLFQGRYKYKHIDSDSYLRHLSVYVNLNDKVHNYIGWTSVSSFRQYVGEAVEVPYYLVDNRDMILSHFKGKEDYRKYANETLTQIILNRDSYHEIGL